jgi:hypothetical protein
VIPSPATTTSTFCTTSGAPLTSWALAGPVSVARGWNGQHLGHDDGERDEGTTTWAHAPGHVRQRRAVGPQSSRSRREARSTSPTPATDESSGSPVPVLLRSNGVSTREAGSPTCQGIAVDSSDNVYITKRRRIGQKFDADGNLLASSAGRATPTGSERSGALALGPDGYLYVADDQPGSDSTLWGYVVGGGAGVNAVQVARRDRRQRGRERVRRHGERPDKVLGFRHVPPYVGVFGTEDGNFKARRGSDRQVWERLGRGRREQPDEVQPDRHVPGEWGSSGSGDGGLSGRDLAIDAEGTVWVVDKGTKPASAVHDGGCVPLEARRSRSISTPGSSAFRWGSRSFHRPHPGDRLRQQPGSGLRGQERSRPR